MSDLSDGMLCVMDTLIGRLVHRVGAIPRSDVGRLVLLARGMCFRGRTSFRGNHSGNYGSAGF